MAWLEFCCCDGLIGLIGGSFFLLIACVRVLVLVKLVKGVCFLLILLFALGIFALGIFFE
jgi:hypothetical protein